MNNRIICFDIKDLGKQLKRLGMLIVQDQVWKIHPLHQQGASKTWHDKYGIQLEAWAPFGEGKGEMFANPTLVEIGAKYGKTVAQVILRWHLQRGIIVIPKSTHYNRMVENFDVFDFVLLDEDMRMIAELDTKQSAFFSHYDPNMVEWFGKMEIQMCYVMSL